MADVGAKQIADLIAPLRVRPGDKVHLAKDFDPGYKAGFLRKKDSVELLRSVIAMLADYQARLAAESRYGVLVCLQALDAGGKDGTIRHVMSGVNPQGVRVSSFKVPSAEELDHDYLWRYARQLPWRGEIGIFNRSHYEEVLVVRVHPENLDRQKLPEGSKGRSVWRHRYREINNWEQHLSENGFRVVKIFLNISKEEQRGDVDNFNDDAQLRYGYITTRGVDVYVLGHGIPAEPGNHIRGVPLDAGDPLVHEREALFIGSHYASGVFARETDSGFDAGVCYERDRIVEVALPLVRRLKG